MSHRGLPVPPHMAHQLSPAQELAETLIQALEQFAHPGHHGDYPRPLHGAQHSQYTDDFFIYPATFAALAAAGGAGVFNIPIQADSDFEWIESTCAAFIDGTAAGTALTDALYIPIDVQIVDSGSGRQLFNQPVPITSFAGTGKQPFILPVPRKFMARSNIQITATNNDPNNKYDQVFLNLIGRKIFKMGPHR